MLDNILTLRSDNERLFVSDLINQIRLASMAVLGLPFEI